MNNLDNIFKEIYCIDNINSNVNVCEECRYYCLGCINIDLQFIWNCEGIEIREFFKHLNLGIII